MKHSKSLKFVLPILLILLMGMGIFSGCLGNMTTPSSTVPDEGSGDEVVLRVTYKEINLDEGNFSIEVCSLNLLGLNASGFNYNYYDEEGVEITDLANFIGIPFDVVPSTSIGTPGSPTEVNNIPLYFNEVENYFIANPDVKQISCMVNLIGSDSLGNEITELIMSNIPIIESGVEHQEVNAVIQTTPNPPIGEVPLTVSFDAGASTTEDPRGVAKYCWHFGDGSHGTCFTCSCPSDLECPMHTYEDPGTYVATLCVWDYNDNLDCAAVVVTVNAIQMNMTVTANPATIAPKETSAISAYLTDQYDNPISDGTKVAFYTTDGTLSAVFADTVGGIATVDLTLNEPVIATVTAVCDDASGSIIVRAVELGITVTANPVTISPGDSSVISAYLVDTFGEPVPDGTTITFSTSEGTLSSNFADTVAGVATVDLQLSRITTAIVTANYGAVSGSATVTCTDGPIAIIENDTDDQISPIEITANSDCPYTITFNAYKSIIGTSPPLTYQWNMTLPDGSVDDLGTAVVTSPYIFRDCGIYVITLTVTDSCTVPCPHSDTATMRIIVTNPEGPTAIITSSELIEGSDINIIANSDCAYPVTFWGDYSTTTAICGDITGWSWTIVEPDSTTTVDIASGMMMTYSFDECGTYVVALEVTDGCDRTANTFVTVIVSAPDGPTAVITSNESIVDSEINITANSDCPHSITFYGHESSSPECEGITEYDWQIIDPNGSEVPAGDIDTDNDSPDGIKMVYNNFNIHGNYSVKLTVTDGCENTASETLAVIVSVPTGPTAVITSNESIVDSEINITANSDCPHSITFYGHESSSPECEGITEYDWQIIDPNGSEVPAGDIDTDNDSPDGIKMVYNNFNIHGNYSVKLTVTDGCENTASETLAVIVSVPTGPTAVISPSSPINITACSGGTYPIYFDAYDSESNASCKVLTYAWSVSGSPGTTEPSDTAEEVTFSCTFSDWGEYTVTLLVTDVCGNTDSDEVEVNVSDCCLAASFTYSPTAPVNTGDVITFNASTSSADCGCGVVTYEWDWDYDVGDFTDEGTGQITTHAYDALGTYTVALKVTDSCGQTAMATMDVVVEAPAAPQASITITSIDDKTVSVSGVGSTTGCPDEMIYYDWNWGDSEDNGTGVTSVHTYDTYESVTISLTVTDSCGGSNTATVTFDLATPAGPLAAINVINIDGLTVNVSGASSTTECPGGITDYNWDWDADGGIAVDASGVTSGHTYDTGDSYIITLTVIDACGSSTATVVVNVSDPTPPVAVLQILGTSDVAHGIVNVSGATSYTGCPGGITDYEWDWDYTDVGSVNPTGFNPGGATSAYTYDTGETITYTIALRVTDACDEISISTAQVYIP